MMRLSLKRAARRLGIRWSEPHMQLESPSHRALFNILREIQLSTRIRLWRECLLLVAAVASIVALLGIYLAWGTGRDIRRIVNNTEWLVARVASFSPISEEYIFHPPTREDFDHFTNRFPVAQQPAARASIKRAQAALDSGNYPEAIKLYGKLIEENPKEGYFYVNLGFARYKQKDLIGAEKEWQSGLKADSSNGLLAYNLGMYYAILRNNSSALEYFDMALALNPSICEAYFHRGRIEFLLKDYFNAQKDFAKAVHCDQSLIKDIDSIVRGE